ncbi:aryl-alcohol dehydrogenase-like predicted oxidoreductase/enamine deaminase RidA (YjgF/YER057c/UK114 family) [Variovorax sp. GrIS 2.14]|uniref:aldo/keto reductase n=1 Tax=Variovorax sp. GrIS 2.14 TaxID=3071709 RepID=UPI0038F792F1
MSLPSSPAEKPGRILLAPGLEISRIVTGLWQVADMERGGTLIDPQHGAAAMAQYARAGFDTFDMADHYGSAEVITGRLLTSPDRPDARAFTKWCPPPGPMTAAVVREGVMRSIDRLQVPCIDLLQFHWWTFDDPRYIDAMVELAKLREEGLIAHLGLANFDTAHLRVLLSEGIPIVSNQVCMSLLDRRGTEAMASLCLDRGVRLLTYGVLGGGFLSEKWLGAAEPAEVNDWSKMKYRRFIDAVGGWAALQAVLQAAHGVGRKHSVSISNVATRWVLEQPAVAAVILGARLGEREHRADNLKLFDFALDHEDHAALNAAFANTRRLPGDCGDEYRRPPFLTASGDLSHHLESVAPLWPRHRVAGDANRWTIDSRSVWEPLAGYARAVRVGERIIVSGTTATHSSGQLIGQGDAAVQATYILDKIEASIKALGGRLQEVVRTRIYLTDAADWQSVSAVHGHYFGHIRPANTMLAVAALIGDGYRVEIEAEAITDSAL